MFKNNEIKYFRELLSQRSLIEIRFSGNMICVHFFAFVKVIISILKFVIADGKVPHFQIITQDKFLIQFIRIR